MRGDRPAALRCYHHLAIDGTPEVLAALLAGLGLAVLGQLIVMSGRRLQRDFAIMKALGLLRRQVRWITAWQMTSVTVIALLIGLPLGIALGRWVGCCSPPVLASRAALYPGANRGADGARRRPGRERNGVLRPAQPRG